MISSSTAAGLGVAGAAAVCYEIGYAYQALQARAVPAAHALRPSLLTHLARNARWLAATALSLLGWPLQVAALALAPLALVQPTLAFGLLLLLVFGVRVLHEHVGRRELMAVALVIAGIAVVAYSAPRQQTTTGGAGVAVAMTVLAALAVVPYVARGLAPAALPIFAAGAADSVAALAAKVVSGELADDRFVLAVAFTGVAGLAGVLATTSEMSALQRAPATRVGPIVLAIQIAVPVAVAGLVGGEDWSATPLGGSALGAGLVATVAGAAVLTASPAVTALSRTPARGPHPPPS